MVRTKLIKKGQVMFREGGTSDYAYIVESGSFKVSKTFEDGKTRVVSILKKNDMFGEMGVIEKLPRSATVTAMEDGRVTLLGKDDFELLAENHPQALMPIMKLLSSRLRKTLRLASYFAKDNKASARI
ncbi:MAG: cyclic nucleotide-binding domain-containing protein [Nitrospinae bacterium]|nr:cyclic nucleotide-binding domain-containing protein [Nitrospinota bacterium]